MIAESTALAKIVNVGVLLTISTMTALIVDASASMMAVAAFGASLGALVLLYYRRETVKLEALYKIGAGTITGLVMGSVAKAHFRVEDPNYTLGLFFLSGLLSLTLLGALLNLTDKNAMQIVARLFKSFGVTPEKDVKKVK